MPYDIESLTAYAVEAIADLAREHRHETFYAFAIDADLMCLNSVEAFAATLDRYRTGRFGDRYQREEDVARLRENTGDWAYMGFADFADLPGFDAALYDEHYDMGLDNPADPALRSTPYAIAMDAVIRNLIERDAFAPLRRTPDFTAMRVEHNY